MLVYQGVTMLYHGAPCHRIRLVGSWSTSGGCRLQAMVMASVCVCVTHIQGRIKEYVDKFKIDYIYYIYIFYIYCIYYYIYIILYINIYNIYDIIYILYIYILFILCLLYALWFIKLNSWQDEWMNQEIGPNLQLLTMSLILWQEWL